MRTGLVVAVVIAAAAGCGTEPPSAPAFSAPPPASAVPVPSAPPSAPAPPSPSPAAAVTTRTTAGVRTSDGWEITVYYTAVERFHDGEPEQVTGCPRLDCTNGDDDLGSYPSGFVDAVRDEGTGLTASGKYLNWSYDVGFWLDTAPRTSDGGSLVPYFSAATDPDVLRRGTRFTIADCGRQEDGSPPPAEVCTRLRAASWEITDEFTPGLGGPRHLDVYIGPETGPDFTSSPWYLALVGARLSLR